MSDSKDKKNIVDFNSFRQSKIINEEITNGRKPLFVSHKNGKISGNPNGQVNDFDARVERIRKSLDRINQLMQELRKKSSDA